MEAIKLSTIFYPLIISIIFLIISIFILIYANSSKNPNKLSNKNIQSKESITQNTIIIFTFTVTILILCLMFLPNFRDLTQLFSQISNVIYVILYTIFLILMFRLIPDKILKDYSLIILIPSLLITFFLFYNAFTTNYFEKFNINYERIKMILLYFSFLTICFTFYSINPGGYIQKYFGTSSLLALLLGFFGFLYIIILFTLPGTYENIIYNKDKTFDNISKYSIFGSIFFVLFLIVITVIIMTYPNGFFSKMQNNLAMILILIVCVLWSILLVWHNFSDMNIINKDLVNTNLTFYQKALVSLFGIIFSGILIAYLVYSLRGLSSKTGITNFVLSVILILSVLTIIYKLIFVKLPSYQLNNKKNSFFELILNILLYIPCIFSGIIDTIMKVFINEYKSNSLLSYLILLLLIVFIFTYLFLFPLIQSKLNTQGGKQILENPINMNILTTLSSYQQLNNSENLDYQYGLSFWVFVDSSPPNTNENYSKYTSILNYGGKPNILYNAEKNTLMITVTQEELSKKNTNNKFIEYDENGNRIIYVNDNFLLQKWNNIIINYNGGTLDIFLNGELVKSSIEVLPYMKYDSLTVGSTNGINGGICNVIYFKNPLVLPSIYYIYNSLKNSNPPVVNYYYKTIIS
jgi:hypothetical protein